MKKMSRNKSRDFTRAYKEHFNNLFRSCLLYVNDREIALDIVQETFAKAWKYTFLGGIVINMKAFLYKIMRNIIISYYRTKKTVSLDSLIEEEHFDPPTNLNVSIEEHIDGEMAFKYLDDIPKKDKKVVIMHFVRGLNFKKIASLTHKSENTVVVQFHRTVKKLRNLFYHTK